MTLVMPIGPGGSSGDNNKINQAKYHLTILKSMENSAARRIQAVKAISKLLFKVQNPPEQILDDLIECYEKEKEGNVKAAIFQRAVQSYYPALKAKKLFFETVELVLKAGLGSKSLETFYNPSVLTEMFCERGLKLGHDEFKELFDFLGKYKISTPPDIDRDEFFGNSVSSLLFSMVNSSEACESSYIREYLESSDWIEWLKSEHKIGNAYAQGVLNVLYPNEFVQVDPGLLNFGLEMMYTLNMSGESLELGDEVSLSVEELKQIYDELSESAKPREFLEDLLRSGKRVIAINSYSSDLLLFDRETPEDFISLAESGDYRITHFAIPLHESHKSLLYKFLSGEDNPITDKLICDYYFTDKKLEDFSEAKDMFKSMISAFLSVGGEILFYGGDSGLEGELLAENKANKIKEVLDLDPSSRVVLYSADYEMAKVDIDYIDSEPKISFVKTLSEVIGENQVVSILSQDEDCWEMLEMELLDLLQILPLESPDSDLKDFGVVLEGKKLGNLRFSLNSTQKFAQAFDALLFRRTFNDDDDDGDDDSPVDFSPTESPELLLV